MLVWVLLFCLSLMIVVNRWFKERRAHKLPPQCSQALPIIGVTHLLLGGNKGVWNSLKMASEDCQKQGGVTYAKIALQIYYFIADPEDCLTISNACLHRHFGFDFLKCWIGEGLITASDGLWKRNRKLLNPAFSLPVIHGFLGVFNEQAKVIINNMSKHAGKGYFDTAPYINPTILRITCLTTFGTSNNDKGFLEDYSKTVHEMLIMIIKRFLNPLHHNDLVYKLFGHQKKRDQLVKKLHQMIDEVVQYKKAAMKSDLHNKNAYNQENSGITYTPYIDRLIQLGSLTDTEIRDELNTTIAAGFDATSHVLKITLAVVGSYPEVQEEMYNELIKILGPERDVEKGDLPMLMYTEAVIKEALRVYPAIPVFPKYIDHDVKLKNYIARAGSQCFVLPYGVHRNSMWGNDSDQFRPERWFDENRSSASAFAAFSFGKRICIGKTYAMTTLKIVLAHLIRTYRIEGDHTKMRFSYQITLSPYEGHEISIRRRNHNEF